MTTIAWDGTIIAADSCIIHDKYESKRRALKVIDNGDGNIIAFCGTIALGIPMIDWYLSGFNPTDVPKASNCICQLIVVDKFNICRVYDTECPYGEVIEPPHSWGSGSDFAIGAMHMRANAIEAVEVACICDIYSSLPINYRVTLPGNEGSLLIKDLRSKFKYYD